MKRIKSTNGIVHFSNAAVAPLCGRTEIDLLGDAVKPVSTSEPVTCPLCAALYCQVKNAPWKEIETKVLERACYDAVREQAPCN